MFGFGNKKNAIEVSSKPTVQMASSDLQLDQLKNQSPKDAQKSFAEHAKGHPENAFVAGKTTSKDGVTKQEFYSLEVAGLKVKLDKGVTLSPKELIEIEAKKIIIETGPNGRSTVHSGKDVNATLMIDGQIVKIDKGKEAGRAGDLSRNTISVVPTLNPQSLSTAKGQQFQATLAQERIQRQEHENQRAHEPIAPKRPISEISDAEKKLAIQLGVSAAVAGVTATTEAARRTEQGEKGASALRNAAAAATSTRKEVETQKPNSGTVACYTRPSSHP